MIKLLLTSSGITNTSIHDALVGLLGKPVSECKALFVPTGVYPFPGGAFYGGKALFSPLAQLGWKALGILELTALPGIPKEVWSIAIDEADVVLVWGGDPLYLAYWFEESGLIEVLSSRSIVYVGVSAGAMAVAGVIGEAYSEPPVGINRALSPSIIRLGNLTRTFVTARGAGLTDFAIIPHFENTNHPDACGENAALWASHLPVPVYAIDEQTAIRVVDGKVDIISEGNWRLFNAASV